MRNDFLQENIGGGGSSGISPAKQTGRIAWNPAANGFVDDFPSLQFAPKRGNFLQGCVSDLNCETGGGKAGSAGCGDGGLPAARTIFCKACAGGYCWRGNFRVAGRSPGTVKIQNSSSKSDKYVLNSAFK
jgi:hypothetical protein